MAESFISEPSLYVFSPVRHKSDLSLCVQLGSSRCDDAMHTGASDSTQKSLPAGRHINLLSLFLSFSLSLSYHPLIQRLNFHVFSLSLSFFLSLSCPLMQGLHSFFLWSSFFHPALCNDCGCHPAFDLLFSLSYFHSFSVGEGFFQSFIGPERDRKVGSLHTAISPFKPQ